MRKDNLLKNDCIVEQTLISILIEACENGQFDDQKFFKRWFPKDNSYFFLFKKNLHVTNISHAELLALLRSYITHSPQKHPIKNLQFVSSREFKKSITNLVNSFIITRDNTTAILSKIAYIYTCILSNMVVVDSYYGSSAVFLPPHLKLDIASVCGKSGYIHSCGHYVYVRKLAKATKEEFFKELRQYLGPIKKCNKKTMFVAFAHEDFSDYDRHMASEMRNGLDDVKIFVEKCFLGNERLISVLKEMKTAFAASLEIPDAGNFRITNRCVLKKSNVTRGRTIWLIADKEVDEKNVRHPSDVILLICYEQVYINQNQFHIFDENKPAWNAHTTIPHTLAGAMISITKPYWPDNNVAINDPFCGSGTICLEASKFRNTKVSGGDIDPMGPHLLMDNLKYLWPDSKAVSSLLHILKPYDTDDCEKGSKTLSELNAKLPKVIQFVATAAEYDQVSEDKNEEKYQKIVDKIYRKLLAKDRLIFYVGLRAIRRHAAEFSRIGSPMKLWYRAFLTEATQLRRQFKRLFKLYRCQGAGERGRTLILADTYSQSCAINFKLAYKKPSKGLIDYKTRSAMVAHDQRYDVIVTDPPYGINTSEKPDELASLYRLALERMLQSLKPNGQLVICLPEETRTGQQIPFFTHKEIVVQQLMQLACKHKKEAIMASYSVPRNSSLYRPPYYWNSDRALRRVILHFRFRTRISS